MSEACKLNIDLTIKMQNKIIAKPVVELRNTFEWLLLDRRRIHQKTKNKNQKKSFWLPIENSLRDERKNKKKNGADCWPAHKSRQYINISKRLTRTSLPCDYFGSQVVQLRKLNFKMKCIYIVLLLSIGLQALKAEDEVTEITVDSTEVTTDGDKMPLDNEKVKECQKIPENGSEKLFKIELRGTKDRRRCGAMEINRKKSIQFQWTPLVMILS